MRALLATAGKDLRRRLRDPVSLAIWCGIPLLIATVMTLAFGGGDDAHTPTAHVLVADRDDSLASDLLVAALGSAGELFLVERVDEAQGRERLDEGGASALLVVPAGFGEALVDGTPAELQLVTNPAQRVLPGIAENALSLIVDAAFYAQQLLGDELRWLKEGPPEGRATFPSLQVAQLSVRINDLVERVAGVLDPLLLELETSVGPQDDGDDEPSGGLGVYMYPGILFMALLFVGQGLSEDLWLERDRGTLRRFLTAPEPLATFLAGKVLGGAALLALVSFAGLLAGVVAFDLRWAALPLALPWLVLSGGLMFALFLLLQLLASSQRAGSTLTSCIVFPLLMVGGSFFPFEAMEQAMPAWLVALGKATPNGWALVHLKAILWGRVSWGALALGALGMLAVTGGLLALAGRRLRRFAGAG